jgi:hypothetical protein
MRISEITESYKESRHSVEASVAKNNILKTNHAIQSVIVGYKNKKYGAGEALHMLEIIKVELENLFYSEHFADMDVILPRHSKLLQKDWISVDFQLDEYINQIKNDNELREDLVDFKAENGQLSAMSTKRPKTKKDTAKSEVEQLFKENKK